MLAVIREKDRSKPGRASTIKQEVRTAALSYLAHESRLRYCSTGLIKMDRHPICKPNSEKSPFWRALLSSTLKFEISQEQLREPVFVCPTSSLCCEQMKAG
jgi:hypothetical protein